jgi:hypothetical protein
MRWYCCPGQCNLKSGVKIIPERSAYTLIGINLDQPILFQIAEILIFIEQ